LENFLLFGGFIAFVLAMLLIDLKFFHAEEHEPSMRESGSWVAVWVGLAIIFGIGIWVWNSSEAGAEYFAGYITEYSLSVDNMFVFIVIFQYFNVPRAYQHQVLFYGILGAMIFRGIFIAAGVALVENFEWILYIFGAFLIYTAWRIARGGTEEVHPEDNPVIKLAKKRFRTTSEFDGQKLFTVRNGVRLATPLFITLLFVELTDIVFAVDSIPAIFGLTEDPFIILTSNVFAILGLRALYFLLAGSMVRLHLLKYGLAVVLAFVGTKMLLEAVEVEIEIWLSLAVIVGVLGTTTVLSLKIPPPEELGEPTGRDEAAPPEEAGDSAAEHEHTSHEEDKNGEDAVQR
jgi:tellurite resistance protein TerC